MFPKGTVFSKEERYVVHLLPEGNCEFGVSPHLRGDPDGIPEWLMPCGAQTDWGWNPLERETEQVASLPEMWIPHSFIFYFIQYFVEYLLCTRNGPR